MAGTPDVMKAAFTKEQDYFKTRGIEYFDPALSFSRAGADQAPLVRDVRRPCSASPKTRTTSPSTKRFAALDRFDQDVQAQGKKVLEQVEAEDRIAILVVGRPYHLDPGMNHGIPDEFQVQGYPILSIRSIPKDEVWLAALLRGRSQERAGSSPRSTSTTCGRRTTRPTRR